MSATLLRTAGEPFVRVALLWLLLLFPQITFGQGRDSTSQQSVPVALTLRGVGKVEFDVLLVGSRAFIPITTVFKFLRLNVEYNRSTNAVEGFYIKANTRYRIDATGRTATAGDKSVTLTATDIIVRSEDLYLRQELYETLFGLNLRYDPRRLEVRLETKQQLPVFLERAREAARRRRQALEGGLPAADYTMPRRFIPFGFGRLDYSFLSQESQHGPPHRSYALHSGSQFLGGDLDARVDGTINQPLFFDDLALRLRYAFLNTTGIRQLTFGEIITPGLLPANVFGVEITNRPAPRRYFFASEDLAGSVPMGSTSDLYLGGALVDYQRVDESGRYAFSSMLTYGVSRFDVRNFDSTGLERDYEYHLIVPPTMIPPNEVQYEITGGKMHPLKEDQYYGNANVEWGVNSRLTLGVGTDYFTAKALSLTRKFHPTLRATARMTQVLTGDFAFAPSAFSRGQLSLTLPSTAGGSLVYTRYAHHPFYNPRDINEEASAVINLPYYGPNFHMSLDVLLRQTILTTFRQRVFQPTLSGQFGIFTPRVTHRREYNWRGFPEDPTIDAITTVSLGIRAPAQFLFRGTTQYFHFDHGFRNLRLELSKRFAREIWLQIFYDRSILTHTSVAGIQFIYYFPFTLFRAVVGTGGDAGIRSSESISGSVGYSGETGDFYLDYLSNRVGFGGIVIQPFVDANANGIQDPGEEIINKATIRTRSISGSSYLRYSPSLGFALPHTLPYEEYVVSIDQQTLDNPLWVPRYNNFALTSEPNQFRQIELPIIVGGVIRGKVEGQSEGKTLPLEGIGITLQAVDTTEGMRRYSASASTFSTGEFEIIAVPPGRYVISINEKQAGDLGYRTTQASRTIEIVPKPEGDELNDVNFVLVK